MKKERGLMSINPHGFSEKEIRKGMSKLATAIHRMASDRDEVRSERKRAEMALELASWVDELDILDTSREYWSKQR